MRAVWKTGAVWNIRNGIVLLFAALALLLAAGCSSDGTKADASGGSDDGSGNASARPSGDTASPLTGNVVRINSNPKSYDVPINEGCDCPEDVEYVCGADGRKYFNACEAECIGVTYVPGECNTRASTLQMFPCGATGGGLSTAYNPVCAKILRSESFVKWQTFVNAQTACGFRNQGMRVQEYTRGECQ